MAVTLGTGLKSIQINYEDAPGEYFLIQFNPKDPQLVTRLNSFTSNLQSRTMGVERIKLGEDGKPVDNQYIEVFDNITDILCEELDKVFAKPISKELFKYCGPFAIIDDEFFIVNFINAIEPEVQAIMDDSLKEVRRAMNKHTDKYKK